MERFGKVIQSRMGVQSGFPSKPKLKREKRINQAKENSGFPSIIKSNFGNGKKNLKGIQIHLVVLNLAFRKKKKKLVRDKTLKGEMEQFHYSSVCPVKD